MPQAEPLPRDERRRPAIDTMIRSPREARLCALADRLAAQFAGRAQKHDREGSFPFENYTELHQAGYLRLPLPRNYGGEDLSLYELMLVQERLARGDGSTALAVGWHMGLMLNLRTARTWPERLYEQLCRDIAERGVLLNALATEPATGSPSRGGMPQTAAKRVEAGWLLSGRKTFSTLSPLLDRFLVNASLEDGTIGEFLVYADDRVHIEETWDTMSMRATGSHDVILDDVFVLDSLLLERVRPGEPLKRYGDGAGWMLHIPACYLGIAGAARDYAARYALAYRPNSLNGQAIAELPHIQDKLGQMEAELRTSRSLLYRVAELWDEQPERRLLLRSDLGLAKYAITHAAIRVVDLAMRIVGGASLSRELPLERMYRDVRAGLHNPPMDDHALRDLALSALHEFDTPE